MGRKQRGFEWTQDPEDPSAIEKVVRPGRGENKAHRKELELLILETVRRSKGERATLGLDASILKVLDQLASAPANSTRRRLVLRAQNVMRDVDLDDLRAALAGDTPAAARLRQQERWRKRLLEDGDVALAAFVEACPAVDRQHLRSLLRQCGRDGKVGQRARKQVFRLIGELLEASETED